MQHIKPPFYGEFHPGPVKLYLDDLERILSEFKSYRDAAAKVEPSHTEPRIVVSAATSRFGRDEFTDVPDSLEEMQQHYGNRLSRSLKIIGPRGLSFDSHRLLGVSVRADRDEAQLAFSRIVSLLKDRRRWFWPLLRLPPHWFVLGYILFFVAYQLRNGQWNAPEWLALSTLAAALSIAGAWGVGGWSAIFLVRRHEPGAKWIDPALRANIIAVVIGALVDQLLTRACSGGR